MTELNPFREGDAVAFTQAYVELAGISAPPIGRVARINGSLVSVSFSDAFFVCADYSWLRPLGPLEQLAMEAD